MHDQRDAECGPRAAGEFRPVCARGRWQALAGHAREIDAGLLEYRAALQHARASATALGALPRVFDEARAAVGCLQRRADAILQFMQEGLHDVD